MMFTKISALCGFAAVANAHMFLASPARFATPSATNGPISSSDFPCQATGSITYSSDTVDGSGATEMALGSDQPLAFEGQSVHGGGSCQISITYDENPTSSSTFKVITSIEGGCVARDTAGNLGDDTSATAADPYTYNFTIPDNIPTGNAVIAWTWFNKVGNREMYMQCAPVTLTGTSGDQSNYDSLPDMFVANLDDDADTCHTPSDTDLVFPDPGDVVQKLNGATTAWGTPTGDCTVGVSSDDSSSAADTSSTSAAVAVSVAASATADTGAAGGVFATSGAAAPATAAQTSEASVTAVAATSTATSTALTTTTISAAGSSSSGTTSASTGSTQTGSCSDEGDYVCLDSTQYQVCASGEWSVAMAVADGTTCSGSGSTFAIAASKNRFRKSRSERRNNKRGLPLLFGQA
ncbi:hypothetical protein BD289DRAFT_146541 [Coniella lustricola]|uniref:Chitin-binding type-4 domain-containing protein n=1 Tax=Coniella lustricola TaxID=2025994 RepID=A0A2T2ZUZ5_9PEZI|nr:hypothetical protein BD289DRAFT_146541 [Coniella lustricola]